MSDWRRDHAASVHDFERLVAPQLELYLGGRITITERHPDATARTLDITGGFDALCHTRSGIQGLANRVQWVDETTEIKTRPCPVCDFRTTSVTNYFCARCHFHGWWRDW